MFFIHMACMVVQYNSMVLKARNNLAERFEDAISISGIMKMEIKD